MYICNEINKVLENDFSKKLEVQFIHMSCRYDQNNDVGFKKERKIMIFLLKIKTQAKIIVKGFHIIVIILTRHINTGKEKQ